MENRQMQYTWNPLKVLEGYPYLNYMPSPTESWEYILVFYEYLHCFEQGIEEEKEKRFDDLAVARKAMNYKITDFTVEWPTIALFGNTDVTRSNMVIGFDYGSGFSTTSTTVYLKR